jgi:hypothetical protein
MPKDKKRKREADEVVDAEGAGEEEVKVGSLC